MSFTASALIVSWAAIALLGFALAGVLARLHRLEQAVAGPAPTVTPVGSSLQLPEVEDGPVLALFVDRGCGSCDRAVEGVADLVARGLATVWWRDEAPEVFATTGVPLSPYAVVADRDLRIVAAQPVGGAERLAEVVAAVTALEERAVP